MFHTYSTPIAAMQALKDSGLDRLDTEMRDVGGGLQPVVICNSIRDAETVQGRGFNSRLVTEFAAD
jgi:hypothetical protein